MAPVRTAYVFSVTAVNQSLKYLKMTDMFINVLNRLVDLYICSIILVFYLFCLKYSKQYSFWKHCLLLLCELSGVFVNYLPCNFSCDEVITTEHVISGKTSILNFLSIEVFKLDILRGNTILSLISEGSDDVF